jgi:hypothetical protein
MDDYFDITSFTLSRFGSALEKSEEQTTLNLTNLGIKDEQMKNIVERFPTAKWIKFWMSFNSIRDTGLDELIEGMKRFHIFQRIEELCLGETILTENSEKLLELCAAPQKA